MKNLISAFKLAFLREMTKDVVEAARLRPGQSVPQTGENRTGITLVRPGGSAGYPSFWIRDSAMSFDSDFITTDEVRGLLLLTAQCQNSKAEIKTTSGAVIPPFSVPDHINPDGRPVYFPGTYSSGPDQGGEPYGKRPPFDDQFYFIEMAYYSVKKSGDLGILQREIGGFSLLQRLEKAFNVPPCDEAGIIRTEEENRGVNFGFVDSVVHTGALLMATLLKFRAALQLSELNQMSGKAEAAKTYLSIANQIKKAVPAVFVTPSGWLSATTGIGSQIDVWGTLFALSVGVLTGEDKEKALQAVLEGYRAGTIAYRGNVRQVPTNADYSPQSAWEKTIAPLNTYQNGAYWSTATGWLLEALYQVDRTAFAQAADEYITELMEGDYRKGGAFGSPWECIHPANDYRRCPIYLTSVTMPYASLKKLGFYE